MTTHRLRTVRGDIEPSKMGMTLPHEHVLCDSSVWLQHSDDPLASADPALANLWWMRQNPNSNRSVLVLDDEHLAARELGAFRAAGGGTVIDLTPRELGRDLGSLVRISETTGLHVVAGAGFYIQAAHPSWISAASVDTVAQRIIDDIETGADGTGVRCGVIGEIGMSHPLHADEEKVLRAAALAQSETSAAISVHTAAHAIDEDSALAAADILESEGADLTRVVMGHMDTSLHRPEYHRAVADRGCVIEYDLFGHEFFESENDFQSFGDTERVRAVIDRVREGHVERVLLSHDICYKIQLRTYGGYGYAHVPTNIRARLSLLGLTMTEFDTMVVENPERIYPLRDPNPNSETP